MALRCESRSIHQRRSFLEVSSHKYALWRLAGGAIQFSGSRICLRVARRSAGRRLTGATYWRAIAVLYEAMFALTASPVVAVNRAAAVAHVEGAEAGLRLLDEVGAQDGLAGFEPYWIVRADFCAKTGRSAKRAYHLAIGLQTDPAARAFLVERLTALA
jgi:RNA polymerase sigma-70 factor, ECF subfamily